MDKDAPLFKKISTGNAGVCLCSEHDYVQASEKGWGAAPQAVKAVA